MLLRKLRDMPIVEEMITRYIYLAKDLYKETQINRKKIILIDKKINQRKHLTKHFTKEDI